MRYSYKVLTQKTIHEIIEKSVKLKDIEKEILKSGSYENIVEFVMNTMVGKKVINEISEYKIIFRKELKDFENGIYGTRNISKKISNEIHYSIIQRW